MRPTSPFQPELMRAAVEGEVKAVCAAGAAPFVVGGDHSITTPILRAIHAIHGPVCIVHVDAHFDSIADEIKTAIGDRPTCLTVDVDGVDPAYCPGTGTPVPGSLCSRELLCLLDGLAGVKIVGMDLVEVSPPDDHADLTSMLASHALFAGLGALAVHESQARAAKPGVSPETNGAT